MSIAPPSTKSPSASLDLRLPTVTAKRLTVAGATLDEVIGNLAEGVTGTFTLNSITYNFSVAVSGAIATISFTGDNGGELSSAEAEALLTPSVTTTRPIPPQQTVSELYIRATDGSGNNSNVARTTITINAVDDTAPVEVDDTVASLNEGDTSSNLNILDNDTDLPDNGTLSVYSVGGTVFNLLTDSTNLTYTSGDGYKEVAGSYGTLYIKSDGTSYYIHDGDDDGGLTETFSYVATDGTNQDTGSPGTISLTITAVDDNDPSITDVTVAVDENINDTFTITDLGDTSSGDTDADESALTYSITGGNSAGLQKLIPPQA